MRRGGGGGMAVTGDADAGPKRNMWLGGRGGPRDATACHGCPPAATAVD